ARDQLLRRNVSDLLRPMASDGPTRVLREFPKERILDSAAVDDEWTTRREPAADRWMDERRNLAADPVAGPTTPRIRERKGRQERLRIGVNGMLQDLSDGTNFGELTKVHDGHTVRDRSEEHTSELQSRSDLV